MQVSGSSGPARKTDKSGQSTTGTWLKYLDKLRKRTKGPARATPSLQADHKATSPARPMVPPNKNSKLNIKYTIKIIKTKACVDPPPSRCGDLEVVPVVRPASFPMSKGRGRQECQSCPPAQADTMKYRWSQDCFQSLPMSW